MTSFRGLRREIGIGGIVPHGWQLSWYEPRRRLGVYYPAPLAWLLRAIREFRYRVLLAIDAPSLERAHVFEMQRRQRERVRLAEERARGYLMGWRECFQACLEVVEEEISCAQDEIDVDGWLPILPKPRQRN